MRNSSSAYPIGRRPADGNIAAPTSASITAGAYDRVIVEYSKKKKYPSGRRIFSANENRPYRQIK
jgi:hypothetical protein